MSERGLPSLSERPAGAHWQRIGIRHHHGLNLPLFSLWSRESCGVGEYLDLIPLIEWCAEIGFDVIQLLPLNDGGEDPSPYNALSSCALNPYHLSLTGLQDWNSDSELVRRVERLRNCRGHHVDWPLVRKEKEAFLRRYHQLHFQSVAATEEYQRFVADHPWLATYCEFKGDHDYYRFVQFLCFQQMRRVRRCAREREVLLKGDLPILISPDSADVLAHESLFDRSFAAGAPPDQYSEEGQHWGFPLYRWDEMREQNFRWWNERLKAAEELYDLYRLDHIVGFFRIWAIPHDKKPNEGSYLPKEEEKWVPQGVEVLKQLLQATTMLPIGEDLGIIPGGVREALEQLGIAGTKIPRWERDWFGDGRFIELHHFPAESLTSVSTHDSESLGEWWEKLPEEAEAFALSQKWTYEPKLSLDYRREILRQSHQSKSLFHINLLHEYLRLVPSLCWDEESDDRINVPGTEADTNWSVRFRVPVEEFTSNNTLTEQIRCFSDSSSSSAS